MSNADESASKRFLEFKTAGNFYGNLKVRLHDGVPKWCVEDYSGESWEPIPRYLYEALARFWSDEREREIERTAADRMTATTEDDQ